MRVASTDGTAALLNGGVPGGESIHAVQEGPQGTSASRQSHDHSQAKPLLAYGSKASCQNQEEQS